MTGVLDARSAFGLESGSLAKPRKKGETLAGKDRAGPRLAGEKILKRGLAVADPPRNAMEVDFSPSL